VHVSVEGTMKWDNATISNEVDGADSLAKDLHIDPNKPLIVAGSTAPGEHELLMQAIPDGVQLLCAPRRPEWFDAAAKTFPDCNRRTSSTRKETPYFLLDTIGELDKAYALADIVVIGRSFSPLHGSDPTQSIALGKPTIIGPNVSDFEEMVQLLLQGNGIIQCSGDDLAEQIKSLLDDTTRQDSLYKAGRDVIKSQQGATTRYEELIMEHTPDA
jgi:3-deoxy-D-manno-octulosonic-acid transferase